MATRRSTTKLTAATVERMVYAVRLGVTKRSEICAYAGVSSQWLKDVERDAADPTSERHAAASRLVEALNLARIDQKVRYISEMERAGKDDWRCWDRRLRTLDPEEYGDKPVVSLNVDVETNADLTDEERIVQISRILDIARTRTSGDAYGGTESMDS